MQTVPARITGVCHGAVLAVFLLLFTVAAPAEEENGKYDGASAVVATLHETLVDIMKNAKELGFQGRYDRVEPLVAERFDTPLIVKVILSRYWNEMTAAQQEEFLQLFHRLSVSTYASRFTSWDGEDFVEVGRETLKAGRILIKTELRTRGSNDKPVRLEYLMHHSEEGRWMIISVIANGVNDLSLKRAEYAAVLKERGYEGLVADLKEKIEKMATDSGS